MRRTLSTAALLLASGCLGDLLNIGEGPDEKGGGGGKTGGTGGGSGASGAAGASSGSGGSGGAGASGATDTGGDAGAGGETGGSPSRGGAAGGGSGGARGGSGGAGAGGTGGKGGVTSDPDVIARAAVVLGSCYADDGVSRNAGEIWNYREHRGFWKNFRLQAECIAQAGQGCGALDTCMGWAIEEAPGCTLGRVCDGSTLVNCVEVEGRGTFVWRIDCATIDMDCDARAYCVSEPAVACDEATYVSNCSDEMPQSCVGTVEGPDSEAVISAGPDCAALGLVCAAGVTGSYEPIECTGTGDSCDLVLYGIFDAMSCTGSTLETCVNGRRHDLDCSTIAPGFSCQSYEGIPFCGLASECLPAELFDYGPDISQDGDPVPWCDGTSIVFCNAGRIERIDCTDLGFTGCDVDVGLGCIPSPTSDLRE